MVELCPSAGPDGSVCVTSILVCFAKECASGTGSRIARVPDSFERITSRDGRSHIAYRRRVTVGGAGEARNGALPPLLVLGDPCDVDDLPLRPTGNAVAI